MVDSKSRGNDIYYDNSGVWRYTEDNSICNNNRKDKPCGNCGKHSTVEGHDGCLRSLVGVMNACCGHGDVEECYVQFLDGECISGQDAKVILNILKKYRKENSYES